MLAYTITTLRQVSNTLPAPRSNEGPGLSKGTPGIESTHEILLHALVQAH